MKNVILVSGSLAYDRIMNFPGRFSDHIMADKLHVLNLSFEISRLKERCGGTAGNIAYNLKLLNQEPKILASVGNDFGLYQLKLQKNNIDGQYIQKIFSSKTAFVNIITDLDDNQIAAFFPGAMKEKQIVKTVPKEAKLAIVSPEIKDIMVKQVELYQQKGLPYIFDPGQQLPKFNGEQLKQCIKGAKALIGNDYEISLVKRKTSWSEKKILKNCEILVTTLGNQGSIIQTRKDQFKIKAVKPQKIVDPTGAGDAYRAGFVTGLLQEKTLPECGQLASKIASKAIEHYGAQEHWL